MLLRQKPYDCKHYIVIDDVQLNSLLQLMNFCPKYFYDGNIEEALEVLSNSEVIVVTQTETK